MQNGRLTDTKFEFQPRFGEQDPPNKNLKLLEYPTLETRHQRKASKTTEILGPLDMQR
jgi:hypothetical protein